MNTPLAELFSKQTNRLLERKVESKEEFFSTKKSSKRLLKNSVCFSESI
jgi:hypothetical protein